MFQFSQFHTHKYLQHAKYEQYASKNKKSYMQKPEKLLNGTVPTLGANCRKCFLQGFRAVVQFF